MSYQCALIFKKRGLQAKEDSYYESDLAVAFDIELVCVTFFA